ncbi:hypothetical protein DMI82_11760 [Blautia sp. BCRC 81119]|uniref:leucine-rich repeat domain-containing protein n=1 Tax=Blautia sp. BCRC 81119 TaxID=2212480 RepID=UPI000D73B0C7|nr:leucine-rich repeat domain-containing protein [Blautia sp. BCRC 81119]PWY59255.1 hypothetical protein DMI82_11760 [Blautia sp. BCRC 81119]
MRKQEGIIFYLDALQETAFDIDVNSGITTIYITANMDMLNSIKSFPDVEELVIMEDVSNISIPNTLFPNVKNVTSYSKHFCSKRKYLERYEDIDGKVSALLNTFCQAEDEVIDLQDITAIADYAFKDCKSHDVINVLDVFYFGKDAFSGSWFKKQPFKNGVKMAGPILIDIDRTSDVIELPDDKVKIQRCLVDFTGVKNVITHSTDTFALGHIQTFPNTVTFDLKEPMRNFNSLFKSLHKVAGNTYTYIKNICFSESTERSNGIKVLNNIVYTQDTKMLIACTEGVKHMIIPNGVTSIGERAFASCRFLKSVVIPDSVIEIGEYAFADCEALETVKLGRGITEIPNGAFYGCKKMQHITIPKGVKVIGEYAFGQCGLKAIELNEGLETIKDGVFTMCKSLMEITIPSSVKNFGMNWVDDNTQKILLKKWIPEITPTVVYQEKYDRNEMDILEIYCDEKCISLPRHIKYILMNEMNAEINKFMQNEKDEERFSAFKYASSIQCKDSMAVNEYLRYKSEKAKDFVKKNSRKMALSYLNEKNQEFLLRLLQTELISKVTMKKLLDEINDNDMIEVKTYLLKTLKK